MYKIRDWDEYYETHDTRKYQTLRWVPLPVKLNGRLYRRLVRMKNGPAMFGCWCALLEVGAMGDKGKRGVFQDSSENVFTIEDLAIATDMPETLITDTIATLSNHPFDWIEALSPAVAGNETAIAGDSPATARLNRIELNRIEQNKPLAVVFGCEFFSVDEKQHKAFSEAFPLVDLVTIYPVIASWFVTNPDDPDKPSKLTRIARVRIWIEKKQKELEQEIAKKNEINKPKMIW